MSTLGQASCLPLTGERTVPGVSQENYWFRRHEAAYLALRDRCAGALVLEAGCGEGYGAGLLAEVAARTSPAAIPAPASRGPTSSRCRSATAASMPLSRFR